MITRQNFGWIAIPMLAALLVISRLWHTPWTWVKVLGLALTVVGFGLVSLARFQLGPSFSIAPQARALVTTGIYSVVRHPVYVFSTVGIAGLLLYIGRSHCLWLLAPLIVVQIFLARAEERVLSSAFGDEYRRYRDRTWL